MDIIENCPACGAPHIKNTESPYCPHCLTIINPDPLIKKEILPVPPTEILPIPPTEILHTEDVDKKQNVLTSLLGYVLSPIALFFHVAIKAVTFGYTTYKIPLLYGLATCNKCERETKQLISRERTTFHASILFFIRTYHTFHIECETCGTDIKLTPEYAGTLLRKSNVGIDQNNYLFNLTVGLWFVWFSLIMYLLGA